MRLGAPIGEATDGPASVRRGVYVGGARTGISWDGAVVEELVALPPPVQTVVAVVPGDGVSTASFADDFVAAATVDAVRPVRAPDDIALGADAVARTSTGGGMGVVTNDADEGRDGRTQRLCLNVLLRTCL